MLISSCAVNKLEKQINNTLNRGVSQYSYMMKRLPKDKYPKLIMRTKTNWQPAVQNGGVAVFILERCCFGRSGKVAGIGN